MSDTPVVAIVFAGGVGSRMRTASQPKQFMTVEDKPLLVHTLEHFERNPRVSAIYLSCLEEYIPVAWDVAGRFGLTKLRSVVPGGTTAQMSIFNAMTAALRDGVPGHAVALVHDGVRPVINQDLIDRNIDSAVHRGTAITAIPCFETIAMSLDDARTIESVTQRSLMYILQAPQTFVLGRAHDVNARSLSDGLLGSFVDQAHLMKHYGEALHMVPGFRGNVKITTDFDFLQFKLLIESGELRTATGGHLA
jgi:2-C-methyl-D-erythritol 4-phosphate cytidylyltransferase